MATRVRSYSKINLGLAIGPPRPDGFHGLCTLYQTLALHDFVTVSARFARETRIVLRTNDARVPLDNRNTVWKMVERALLAANRTAEVVVEIEKRLPVQGGMGAGSANAAAALLGIERELNLTLAPDVRMRIAAEVGSDVPLFLIGGSVLGDDRGQMVRGVADVQLNGQAELACCVALPGIGVSTPLAFRDWDRRFFQAAAVGVDQGGQPTLAGEAEKDGGPIATAESLDLHNSSFRDTLDGLSRTYASVFEAKDRKSEDGASGIFPDPRLWPHSQDHPEKQQGLLHEQLHGRLPSEVKSGIEDDLAENTLLALVRTGIENDFETVVFPQNPSLREIKRHLMGILGDPHAAVYAALSGSGSALFGLYRTMADAEKAQQRCQQQGVTAVLTKTMPRALYWNGLFAE